jgi:hypothetical protein
MIKKKKISLCYSIQGLEELKRIYHDFNLHEDDIVKKIPNYQIVHFIDMKEIQTDDEAVYGK